MAVDTPDNLSQRLRGREEVTVEVAGGDPEVDSSGGRWHRRRGRASTIEEAGGDRVSRADPERSRHRRPRRTSRACSRTRWRLLALRSESLSLEEIFLKLTGASDGPALQERD